MAIRLSLLTAYLYCVGIVFVSYLYCKGIYGHVVIITVDVSEIPAFPAKLWNVQLFPGKPVKVMMISFVTDTTQNSKYGKSFSLEGKSKHPCLNQCPPKISISFLSQAINVAQVGL